MGLFNKRKSTQEKVMLELLDYLNEGVIILDKSEKIININRSAISMTGQYSKEIALNTSLSSVVQLHTLDGQLLPEEKRQKYNSRNFKIKNLQNNNLTNIEIKRINLKQSGFEAVLFWDISDELIKEGEQMEFVSTASHEMRTPVAAIEGYLGLALNPDTATIDDRAKKYLKSAHEASKQLGVLFQDLLDVTKVDSNLAKPKMKITEITSLVSKIAATHKPLFKNKGISYKIGGGFKIGRMKLGQLLYANVDEKFLTEILNNLIENAAKYTPKGGTVTIKTVGENNRVIIIVEDTGIGIDPESIKYIFQKFYRVDNSATRNIGGTGLGLFLVKSKVEAMGGQVLVDSIVGKGSKFYVILPRVARKI